MPIAFECKNQPMIFSYHLKIHQIKHMLLCLFHIVCPINIWTFSNVSFLGLSFLLCYFNVLLDTKNIVDRLLLSFFLSIVPVGCIYTYIFMVFWFTENVVSFLMI